MAWQERKDTKKETKVKGDGESIPMPADPPGSKTV